nr:MAG TPA: chromosome segregation ATPase [Caudoviricetes sp.]
MAHDKNCHPFPIEPAPFAPGGECHPCHPDPCCPPRPPRPTPPPRPGCGPSMYVGARYVPKFADPIEWDTERGYESLTIVTYKGESYTSKCPVPPGIDIKNERYWALTGAYNAQVEEYKNQVKDLSEQVTGFASDNKEFREKITQYDKDNAEMKNSVASTVARVDALAERVDNADAAISDLQAGQAQTVKDIAALEAKDADLQRQISSNDTDISAIQAKDREQDARLSAIETVNDAQAATLTQNTQDIARNTANIQDNAANIAVNSKELAKHAEQLKDHAAQLSVLHKEVTDNHTAIERLTSVTDGLRADLTEDEAKIAQNADAIAHIQQKDVQQDGRLDALENRTTAAEGRLDALDTKTDATNAALTAETTRAKAAELENGKLIAKNAQELAKHSDELSDHERRISALETTTDGHTQSIADLKAKDAALDAAIAAVDDKVEHLELIDPKEYAKTIARIDAKDTAQDSEIAALKTASADHVTKQEFAADQKRQDDIVGDWATAHPGQTIAECITSQENELAEHAGSIASLQTDKANKTDIPDVSGYATKVYVDNGLSAKVDTATYTTEQAAQDELIKKKVDQWADSYQRTKCVAMFAAVNKQEDGTLELFGVFPAGNGLRKNPNTSPFSLAYGEGGTVRIFKPDGTEVDKSNIKASYNNWGQAYNMMPTLRVTLKPTFTPDSPFYILLYQNDASKPESL